MALNVASEGLHKTPLQVEVSEAPLGDLPLFIDGRPDEPPSVARFRQQVRECDGLLIVTPVFHDSYSGVLKNALDHLYAELADKVVGVIACGAGRTGQGQALEHLRAVLREAQCWVLPRQVAVARAREAFDAEGKPTDPEIQERLLRLGQELVLRTRQLRPKRSAAPAPPAPTSS